jgi:hypothetical protein
MYLVQDGSHVDVVCKTLADLEIEMLIRLDYFQNALFDCYYTPEVTAKKAVREKGFAFYPLNDDQTPILDKPYGCFVSKIDSLKGLSQEVLYMSSFYLA